MIRVSSFTVKHPSMATAPALPHSQRQGISVAR